MNKELMEAEIIQLHAKRKGVSFSVKEIKNHFAKEIQRQEKVTANAEHEDQVMGGYDDCGEFYRTCLAEEKATLSHLKSAEYPMVSLLVREIERLSHQIGLAKEEFRNVFGQAELDKVNNRIVALGEKAATAHLTTAKKEKAELKALAQIIMSLTGKRFEKHINYNFELLSSKHRADLRKVSNHLDTMLESEMEVSKSSKDRAAKVLARHRTNEVLNSLLGIKPVFDQLESEVSTLEDKDVSSIVNVIVSSYKNATST